MKKTLTSSFFFFFFFSFMLFSFFFFLFFFPNFILQTTFFFLTAFFNLTTAQHLRLVALQKSAVTHELEQVHSSLATLEQELMKSKNENVRLRNISDSINSISNAHNTSHNTSVSSRRDDPNDSPVATSRAKIHVSRTGSIAITRNDDNNNSTTVNIPTSVVSKSATSKTGASQVPLPSSSNTDRVRVRTNRHGSIAISRNDTSKNSYTSGRSGGGSSSSTGVRSTGSLMTPNNNNSTESRSSSLVDGESEPWSIGSNSNISSIRRGTYFGKFS